MLFCWQSVIHFRGERQGGNQKSNSNLVWNKRFELEIINFETVPTVSNLVTSLCYALQSVVLETLKADEETNLSC